MRIERGITRTVWLIGPLAIKLPSLRYAGTFFLKGCLCNLEEAWKWHDTKGKPVLHNMLCPVLWCGWFGLFLVMRRAKPLTMCHRVEEWKFEKVTTDTKRENFGLIDDEVVCVDYA